MSKKNMTGKKKVYRLIYKALSWQYPKKAKWSEPWTRKDEDIGFRHEYKEHGDTFDDNVTVGTPSDDFARDIARDHLREDPKYYQKLRKVGL